MVTKDNLNAVLQSHIGKQNAIGGKALAEKLGVSDRELRFLTCDLIKDRVALCSHPSRGYYIAANREELDHTCEFHHRRGIHELEKEALLKKASLADLSGQLHLRT
jgi:hypothetical protein